MRLSDLEPGQAARLAGQGQRKIIVVRPVKTLMRQGIEVRAVVLHDPGNVMKLGDCFTTDFTCEPVNFQFDGITEPAPAPAAPHDWESRLSELPEAIRQEIRRKIENPHPDPNILEIKCAYFFDRRVLEWRRSGDAPWHGPARFEFDSRRVISALAFYDDYEYRLAPEDAA